MVLSSLPQATEEEPIEIDQEAEASQHAWLLKQLPSLPHFNVVRPQIVQALRQACQVENDPAVVAAYLCFLAQHATSDPLCELSDLVVVCQFNVIQFYLSMNALMFRDTIVGAQVASKSVYFQL